MKKKSGIICLILLLLIAPAAWAATTDSTGTTSSTSSTSSSTSSTSSTDASSLVYVSNVTMDPAEFFPYEEGTIVVTLANSGTTAVGLSDPEILSDKINVVNRDSWSTMTYIGPGATMSYSFRITAEPPDGTYFPLFTIGTKDGGSVHFPLVIKVNSKEITAAVAEQPDAFSKSVGEPVNLSIVNARSGEIKNILVTSSGAGVTVNPSQKYISSLNGESSVEVPFEVTASSETNVTFHISYQNGDTDHAFDVVLPISFGDDKTVAVCTVNNVALTTSGSSYDITGDLTNTGITSAQGLVVTVGSPATGTGTYPEYAIGTLASGDSGSFEVTFTSADLSAVPLVLRWKDSDGDDYSTTKILDLKSASGTGSPATTGVSGSTSTASSGMPQGGPGAMGAGGPPGSTTSLFSSKGSGISSFYPVIAGGLIVIVGIVLWKKRKWLSAKLKKQ
jgi:hypothetical protein